MYTFMCMWKRMNDYTIAISDVSTREHVYLGREIGIDQRENNNCDCRTWGLLIESSCCLTTYARGDRTLCNQQERLLSGTARIC